MGGHVVCASSCCICPCTMQLWWCWNDLWGPKKRWGMEKNGRVLGSSSSLQTSGEIFLEDSPWPKFQFGLWHWLKRTDHDVSPVSVFTPNSYLEQFFCFMHFDGLRKVKEVSMEVLELERREKGCSLRKGAGLWERREKAFQAFGVQF